MLKLLFKWFIVGWNQISNACLSVVIDSFLFLLAAHPIRRNQCHRLPEPIASMKSHLRASAGSPYFNVYWFLQKTIKESSHSEAGEYSISHINLRRFLEGDFFSEESFPGTLMKMYRTHLLAIIVNVGGIYS